MWISSGGENVKGRKEVGEKEEGEEKRKKRGEGEIRENAQKYASWRSEKTFTYLKRRYVMTERRSQKVRPHLSCYL